MSFRGYSTYNEVYFFLFFLPVIAGVIATFIFYWMALEIIGVFLAALYFAAIFYFTYKKLLNKGILTLLFIYSIALFIPYLIADPFLYCELPIIYQEPGEGYTIPLLAGAFNKLGLLNSCERPIF